MSRWHQMIEIKKAVLEVVKSHHTGLTVEQIVEIVKKNYPQLNVTLFRVRDALVRLAVKKEVIYPQQGIVTISSMFCDVQ